jgi:hypothetical protein
MQCNNNKHNYQLSLQPMLVFSNKVSNVSLYEKNIGAIKNKQHLMWLQEMYETCIQKEEDETKMELILKIRDAISMKIQEIERMERIFNAFHS